MLNPRIGKSLFIFLNFIDVRGLQLYPHLVGYPFKVLNLVKTYLVFFQKILTVAWWKFCLFLLTEVVQLSQVCTDLFRHKSSL